MSLVFWFLFYLKRMVMERIFCFVEMEVILVGVMVGRIFSCFSWVILVGVNLFGVWFFIFFRFVFVILGYESRIEILVKNV